MKSINWKEVKKRFDEFHQSKWMRYEEDIIHYYYKSLREWLDTGMKKPSIIAFTSGLGRNIASLMEDAKKQGYDEGYDEAVGNMGD